MLKKVLKFRIGKIFLVAILAFLIFQYCSNLYGNITAGHKVEVARAPAEAAGDSQIATEANLLLSSGAVTNLIASSKVDVCYLDSNAQGFATSGWYQKCYVRYVDGFATNLSHDQAAQKIASLPSGGDYFGTEFTNVYSHKWVDACTLFAINYTYTVDYRAAGTLPDAYLCQIPGQTQAIGDIDPPAAPGQISTKVYRSFDTASLNSSQNQVWIMLDQNYYDENLGCAVPSLLCGSPRARPAT